MNLNKLFENMQPGEMTTIAGVGVREGIPANEADAGWPLGILRWNKTGELLINDYHMHIVWRIDHDGILHRFAGTGVPGYSGDGGPALDSGVLLAARHRPGCAWQHRHQRHPELRLPPHRRRDRNRRDGRRIGQD